VTQLARPDELDPQSVDDLVVAGERRVELAGVLNLRDVGGYPADGGQSVRWRTLLRSDALHLLDPEGAAVLGGFGLRTIVDLRTAMEAELAPSALGGLAASARVRHIPILAGDLEELPLELGAIYEFIIDHCGQAITEAISVLAAEDGLPALVHCSAGKDRTGIVVALVLALLGVPDEVIAADYALSATYLDAERTPAIGQLQASTGLGDELTKLLLSSPPELILAALARVRAVSGSVESYLRERGLSTMDVSRLREALLR
jgi:protein-tyrosine phosphatase